MFRALCVQAIQLDQVVRIVLVGRVTKDFGQSIDTSPDAVVRFGVGDDFQIGREFIVADLSISEIISEHNP